MKIGAWLDRLFPPRHVFGRRVQPSRSIHRCPRGHLLARPNRERRHRQNCAACFHAETYQAANGGTIVEALEELPWARPTLGHLAPIIGEARRTYKHLTFTPTTR